MIHLFGKKSRNSAAASDDAESKRLWKGFYIPKYDFERNRWGVENRRGIHEGDIVYISHIVSGAVLKYPCCYHGNQPDWAENFDQVLEALIRHPEDFSIAGFENWYSDQERCFLRTVKYALLRIIRSGRPLSEEEERAIKEKMAGPDDSGSVEKER